MKHMEVGALLRRDFRRAMITNNINFIEDKGWLTSTFFFPGITPDNWTALRVWVRKFHELSL